jgi:hypothetical protein
MIHIEDLEDRKRDGDYRTPFEYSRAYQTVMWGMMLLVGLYATLTTTIQDAPGGTGWINRLFGPVTVIVSSLLLWDFWRKRRRWRPRLLSQEEWSRRIFHRAADKQHNSPPLPPLE